MAKNKSEQELRQELEAKKLEAFLKEFQEVTEPVYKKHALIMQPIIQINQVGGMNPAWGVGKYKLEEVTYQDPVNESEKPETV
jgi:hypothetical protein